MNTIQSFASELSYLVQLKRQRELNGRDVPKVKAPAEKPATFDAYAVENGFGRVDSGNLITLVTR